MEKVKKSLIFILVGLILIIPYVSANQIMIYSRPLENQNHVFGKVFNMKMEFAENDDCSGVVFTFQDNFRTDDDTGDFFMNITIPANVTNSIKFICEYRNGDLRIAHTLSDNLFNNIYGTLANFSYYHGSGGNLTGIGNLTVETDPLAFNGSLQRSTLTHLSNFTNDGVFVTNDSGLIQNYNATHFILNWSSVLNSSGIILNYDYLNSSGLIQNWNATGLIQNYNSTGLIQNYNATGLIQNYNSTGLIQNYNATGKILNWSNVINISGLVSNWSNILNNSGYIIDWNFTGLIQNYNATGLIQNYNATGLIQNYNATGLITKDRKEDNNTYNGYSNFTDGIVIQGGVTPNVSIIDEAGQNAVFIIGRKFTTEFLKLTYTDDRAVFLFNQDLDESNSHRINWNTAGAMLPAGMLYRWLIHNINKFEVNNNQTISYVPFNSTTDLISGNLNDASCDVKSYVNGTLYCGTDADSVETDPLAYNGSLQRSTLTHLSNFTNDGIFITNNTGLVQNWNATGHITNENATGLIRNYEYLNLSGYIKDWNWTGYIKDWNWTGYIKDWNWTGFIKDWNWTGFIRDWGTEIKSEDNQWSGDNSFNGDVNGTKRNFQMGTSRSVNLGTISTNHHMIFAGAIGSFTGIGMIVPYNGSIDSVTLRYTASVTSENDGMNYYLSVIANDTNFSSTEALPESNATHTVVYKRNRNENTFKEGDYLATRFDTTGAGVGDIRTLTNVVIDVEVYYDG